MLSFSIFSYFLVVFFLESQVYWQVKDIQPLGRGPDGPPIIGCQLPVARWWEPKFIACRDREAGDFFLKPVGNVQQNVLHFLKLR